MAQEPRRVAGCEEGQAAVGFLAVVPLLLAALALLLQLALIGHAAWSAGNAARAAARAVYTGSEPEAAALGALPPGLERRADVEVDGSRVTVRLRANRPIPPLPRVTVSSSAGLGPPEGRAP